MQLGLERGATEPNNELWGLNLSFDGSTGLQSICKVQRWGTKNVPPVLLPPLPTCEKFAPFSNNMWCHGHVTSSC